MGMGTDTGLDLVRRDCGDLMTFLQQEIPQREKDPTEVAPVTVPARVPGSVDQCRPVLAEEQVPRGAGDSQEGERAEGIAREGLRCTGSPAGRSGLQPQHGRGFGGREGVAPKAAAVEQAASLDAVQSWECCLQGMLCR